MVLYHTGSRADHNLDLPDRNKAGNLLGMAEWAPTGCPSLSQRGFRGSVCDCWVLSAGIRRLLICFSAIGLLFFLMFTSKQYVRFWAEVRVVFKQSQQVFCHKVGGKLVSGSYVCVDVLIYGNTHYQSMQSWYFHTLWFILYVSLCCTFTFWTISKPGQLNIL